MKRTTIINEPQTKKARKRWGANAIAVKEKAYHYRDGRCSVCSSHGCTRKNQHTLGVIEGGGLFLSVKARGHTWIEAWDNVNERNQ